MVGDRHTGRGAVFDPFGDRLARDIRNSLSSALIAELGGASGAVDGQAREWLAQVTLPVYRDYILGRQALYHQIVGRVRAAHVGNPRLQSLMLWNAGLFFEVHELLETIWRSVSHGERTALKGLIQAAGVYVHLSRGKPATARKLAAKARSTLQAGMASLTFIANPEDLLAELASPDIPPQLKVAPGCGPRKAPDGFRV